MFQTPNQREIFERISGWVSELFGTKARFRPDEPIIDVFAASAVAQVFVQPWDGDETIVTVRSWVVSGAEPSLELYQYLLQENAAMVFGAFGVDEDGNIFLEHTIVGQTCDPEELKSSAEAVALMADEYDDLIVDRWGGTRAIDPIDMPD